MAVIKPTDSDSNPVKKLEGLQNRINDIGKKKAAAEAELKILQENHDELVEKLKEMGIEDVSDLPGTIAEYEKAIDNQITQIEASLTEIEALV